MKLKTKIDGLKVANQFGSSHIAPIKTDANPTTILPTAHFTDSSELMLETEQANC